MKQQYISYSKGSSSNSYKVNRAKAPKKINSFKVIKKILKVLKYIFALIIRSKKLAAVLFVVFIVAIWQSIILSDRVSKVFIGNSQTVISMDQKSLDHINNSVKTKGILSNIIYFYDFSKAENNIKAGNSSIKDVNIGIQRLKRKIVVRLELKNPMFILKDSLGIEYFVGENGEFFPIDRSVYPDSTIDKIRAKPTIVSQYNLSNINPVDKTHNLLTSSDIHFLQGFTDESTAQGYNILRIIQGENVGQIELEIQDLPGKIKVQIEDDPRQQVSAMAAIIERLKLDNKTQVEYIDVRAGERIYVR